MVIVHDLAEVYVGDYHAFRDVPKNKHQLEKDALTSLTSKIPTKSAAEILELWSEFEENLTMEARFAVALDKLEVLIQHNEADISTWEEKEFYFNFEYAYDKVEFSKVLKQFRDLVLVETAEKVANEKT